MAVKMVQAYLHSLSSLINPEPLSKEGMHGLCNRNKQGNINKISNEQKYKENLKNTKQVLNLQSFQDRSRRVAPSTEATAKELELYKHTQHTLTHLPAFNIYCSDFQQPCSKEGGQKV